MPEPRKRKIAAPDGRIVDAFIMPFQAGGEHWNEYLVDDGTVIKIKLIVTEVLRLEGEYDPKGDPIYLIESTNVTNVSAPTHLQKEG